jgi:UDP-N-acetylmuramyl pentapeptide phosphotransferase/UDP-N-acetylglucosamine-1-phosphate transferase
MMIFLLVPLSFACSYALTKFLINALTNLGLVDRPDDIRRLHKRVTPRGAGVSIVIIVMVGLCALDYFSDSKALQAAIFLPIFFLISFISFLDDIAEIPIAVRLAIHLICSTCAIFFFLFPVSLFHGSLPPPLDYVLAVICFTAFINIFNFLDGMDGISLSEGIHLSLTILILCYLKSDIIVNNALIVAIAAIVLGSSAGILPFNRPPAKVFLGDVGSICLGFLLGFCFLMLAASAPELFIASLIANLYYIVDGAGTICIRFINKEKIWQAHYKHFFQKAIKRGKDIKKILYHIILCNAILMTLAVCALYFPVASLILAILTVSVTLVFLSH